LLVSVVQRGEGQVMPGIGGLEFTRQMSIRWIGKYLVSGKSSPCLSGGIGVTKGVRLSRRSAAIAICVRSFLARYACGTL